MLGQFLVNEVNDANQADFIPIEYMRIVGSSSKGENGAVISLLTQNNGRQAGYVRGATSSKMRGTLEQGNIVEARWQARDSGNLGSLTLELVHNPSARFLSDPLKLSAMQAACGLCDQGLPEREASEGLFHGIQALFAAFMLMFAAGFLFGGFWIFFAKVK